MKKYLYITLSYLSKIETSYLLFLIFVFCLPFFKKINFYLDFSFLEGRFIDYLTPSFYGFDFVLAPIFIIWLIEVVVKKGKIYYPEWKISFAYLLLVMFSVISIFFSIDRLVSLYYIFVLLVLGVLFVYVFNKFRNKRNIFLFLNTFIFTMSLQSALAIAQFFNNSSLGFGFFGEQVLSPKIAGVAKVMFGSVKYIRPYGTFSHPNILALFLVIAGISALYLIFKYKNRYYKAALFISIFLISFALFLSFSRLLWVLAFFSFGTIIFVNIRNKKVFFKKYKFYFLLSLLPALFFVYYFYPAIYWRINFINPEFWWSFNDRALIISKNWLIIKNNFMGVGIGNFVIEEAFQLTGYPSWMAEPVHNTPLLILAEIGWLGFSSFIFFIYSFIRILRKKVLYIKIIFLMIFIYMFFDHCFWDIRQAQLVLVLFFGLFAVSLCDKEATNI